MSIFRRLLAWARPPIAPITLPVAEPLTPQPLNVSARVLAALAQKPGRNRVAPFGGLPVPPPGVRPAADAAPRGMAMDDLSGTGADYGAWSQQGLWGEGLYFLGYPYLAELSQRPEYRHITETMAEEMTRKWIKITSVANEDNAERIKDLEAAMLRYGVRGAINRALELDGFMGQGIIYIDTGATDDPEELRAPLLVDGRKLEKGGLKGFVVVDPTWVSPMAYNSTDPLRPDYFKPTSWYVMGKLVHSSRLIFIRSRELPDILKASYNFGGLSMSQMAKPYVDNWLRTRQSVSDLLHSFTVFVLKTPMQSLIGNSEAMLGRITAFILGRDNQGLMMVDKDTEELENISAPLGTLDHLQAQAQEQLASVSQLPLVKMTGITPSGLNASSDGEIRVFYDRIHARQEKVLGEPMTLIIKLIQLSEFGDVDPGIRHEFLPLWELDAAGRAAVEKIKADIDAVYMAAAVISNEEARDRIVADPESGYHGIAGAAPELDPHLADLDTDVTDPAEQIGAAGLSSKGGGANSGV